MEELDKKVKSIWQNYADEVRGNCLSDRQALHANHEKKANRTAFFRLIYICSQHKEPAQQDLESAKELQGVFFAENPFRIYPDVKIFEPIIGSLKSQSSNMFEMGALRALALGLQEDMRLARYRM